MAGKIRSLQGDYILDQQCRSTIWMPISRAFEASGRKHHTRYNGSGTEPPAFGIRIRYHTTKTERHPWTSSRGHCSRTRPASCSRLTIVRSFHFRGVTSIAGSNCKAGQRNQLFKRAEKNSAPLEQEERARSSRPRSFDFSRMRVRRDLVEKEKPRNRKQAEGELIILSMASRRR